MKFIQPPTPLWSAQAKAVCSVPCRRAVRSVLVLAPAVGGTVSTARLCTEALMDLAGPDGSTKPSSVYVWNGSIFDPAVTW